MPSVSSEGSKGARRGAESGERAPPTRAAMAFSGQEGSHSSPTPCTLLASREDVMRDAEQLRHLSPLLHHHVNPYDKFEIDRRGSELLEGIQ